MLSNHPTDPRSTCQRGLAKCSPAKAAEQSDFEPSSAEKLGLEYVQSIPFAEDARVGGYLVQADVRPITYGYLYGANPPEADMARSLYNVLNSSL